MAIYTADPELLGRKRNWPIRVGSLLFAVLWPISLGVDWLWPSGTVKQSPLELAMSATVFPAVFAISYVASAIWSQRKQMRDPYQLTVDEDGMSMFLDSSGLYSFLHMRVVKRVSRDEIRTVFERKNGLSVSKYGWLGTLLMGGVWIPNKLPEYEYLKSLVMTWKAPSVI